MWDRLILSWEVTIDLKIQTKRKEGATIGQLAKDFNLGEATIYRALTSLKSD